jgi:hypothetical protein
MKMAQVLKSTTYFELFGGATLARLAEGTENSKAAVSLVRCAVFGLQLPNLGSILLDIA